jgi:protein CpxP
MMRMTSRKGLWTAIAVFAGAIALAVPLLAQTTSGSGAVGGRPGLRALRILQRRRVARQLGLSDGQKQQIRGIVQSHRDEWKALAERARAARQAVNQSVTADNVDEAAIRNSSAQLAAVQADVAVARAHARAEIWNVLTPDQQSKAATLKADRRRR